MTPDSARGVRHAFTGALLAVAVLTLTACGEGGTGVTGGAAAPEGRSVATGASESEYLVISESDAGRGTVIIEMYEWDIGLPDKRGPEIHLSGDDSSSLRWRFAEKPDDFLVEWAKVNGELAFETDGLIGNPAVAAKVLEFRGLRRGETTFSFELVDTEAIDAEPAKRLEYTFQVETPRGGIGTKFGCCW